MQKTQGMTAERAEPRERPQTGSLQFPIVGLGAAAGGQQALSAFFAAMPDDSGMAFMLIYRGEPDGERQIAEELAKHTKMPIALATDGAKIAPNHIYVLPALCTAMIAGGALRLSDPASGRRLHHPINQFLRALAQSHGANAVAIILSGAGSDGAAALAEVKAHGGIVLVQDPKEAQQDAMPRSAIAMHTADHVLPVAAMPQVLAGFARHPFIKSDAAPTPFGEKARAVLPQIIDVLKSHTPIDFGLYKEGTLLRRIERRMVLRHLIDADDYLALLRTAPQESERLGNDFLITVTRFFRDPEAFQYISDTVLPAIIANHTSSDPIRIWVPGCASGEEAFSLAMIMIEQITAMDKDLKFQIFASDVDARSLEIARAGVYPDTIEADVSAARLKRFFHKDDHRYRVGRVLRDAVVFTKQNILADAPFAKLDMIACRHVLIYLKPKAQELAIAQFHFALNKGGVLFLGGSETPGNHDALFSAMSRHTHVYQKQDPVLSRTAALTAPHHAAKAMQQRVQSTNEQLETSREELQSLNEELIALNAQLQKKVDEERRLSDDLNNLLASSGVATLILDRKLNIMRFTPNTRALFQITSQDIGQPFANYAGKVQDPDLMHDATLVLERHQTIEAELLSETGHAYVRRILPYRTQDGAIDGVVVRFSDVSDLKKLQKASQKARKFAERVVDTIRDPLLILDARLRIVSVNQSFHRAFGTADEDVIGQDLFTIQSARWNIAQLRRVLERVLPDKTTVEGFEATSDPHQMGPRHMLLNARQVEGDAEGGELILLAIEDVTAVKQAAQEIMDREARLRAILDAAPEAIVTIDDHGIIGSFSPAAEEIFGYRAAEIIGKNVNILMPDQDRRHHDGYMTRYLNTGEARIIGRGRDMDGLRKDGTTVPIRLLISELELDGERHFLGILQDLTEDKKRRAQLQRAQKMEAVGQLTGGLAHDFNNLLTVVIGNLELLDMRLENQDHKDLINEALEASSLGATLTSQLLSFSKRQALAPEAVDLNVLVETMQPLLKRSLGEHIKIETALCDTLHATIADPGKIESAILNMAINARDAMPEGGTITIETRNTVLGEDYAATQIDVTPGDYVALSVTDTGTGMPPEVLENVFEPFFSTKGPGGGSGLGLSMIYGFAKQSGGHVAIYSEVGRGTTVNLFLPSATQTGAKASAPDTQTVSRANGQTILVVEDEPLVRRLTAARLDQLGYQVIVACDGPEAIKILRENDQIDLVLSDIIMPGGMTGFDVADQALVLKPTLKVLLATGYARGAEPEKGDANPQHHKILRKPYGLHALSEALRELLDA
ncbi:CheR family methyltransferase [Yoonia sp.]|uniref:CheR family methyltransferase n=1 Tax=Yoonia sp. TaxID=2212373 RepID=UPI00358F78E0